MLSPVSGPDGSGRRTRTPTAVAPPSLHRATSRRDLSAASASSLSRLRAAPGLPSRTAGRARTTRAVRTGIVGELGTAPEPDRNHRHRPEGLDPVTTPGAVRTGIDGEPYARDRAGVRDRSACAFPDSLPASADPCARERAPDRLEPRIAPAPAGAPAPSASTW